MQMPSAGPTTVNTCISIPSRTLTAFPALLVDRQGYALDGGKEVGVEIEGTYIQGNNQANVGKHGITINGHLNSVTIVGNHIGNYPEVGGNQGYGSGQYPTWRG
jgi:hypothetical protein